MVGALRDFLGTLAGFRVWIAWCFEVWLAGWWERDGYICIWMDICFRAIMSAAALEKKKKTTAESRSPSCPPRGCESPW
jgi:hypothetical protein